MEYEKHIKRLVLGFLKNECKNAYKIFLKSNFQNQSKHIATRVAGQSLEDILRIYSRVQDIVQGRLEDTDYFKESGSDFSSPVYLAEQLLYLLDKDRPFTPGSTIGDRSPAGSTVTDILHYGIEDTVSHYSDVETTPEHTLPGNIPSSCDKHNSRTPYRKKSSPIFRTPLLENIPNSEHEHLSSVIQDSLLKKSYFHTKLANNITSAKCELVVDKKNVGAELEDTIKNALNRTVDDPMFENLLRDFICPVGNTVIGNAFTGGTASSTSSSSTTHSITPSKQATNMGDQNNGAVSSILACSASNHSAASNCDPPINNVVQIESNPTQVAASVSDIGSKETPTNQVTNKVVPAEEPSKYVTRSEKIVEQALLQKPSSSQGNLPQILPNPSGIYTTTSTNISQSGNQQQQFYIVNQPYMISQPNQIMQLVQPVQTIGKSTLIDSSQKIFPKVTANLTEQDIMSMPTIILNDRLEVTSYSDPNNIALNTPYKLNEVHNIKEYLNVFGATDQSPIIKKTQKKATPLIKPTPTIKVEIYQRDTPMPRDVAENTNITIPDTSEGLPNLMDIFNKEQFSGNLTNDSSNQNQSKSDSIKIASNDKIKAETSRSVSCTPPPSLVTVVRKPTPKSGSHVRNLAFPSPIRKTPSEKPESNSISPSSLNKQQAAKDLFKNEIENQSKAKQFRPKKSASPQKTISPKKAVSPKKKVTPKRESPKKIPYPTKKNIIPKNEKDDLKKKCTKPKELVKDKISWDATIRKNLSCIEENESTPVRKKPARKRSRRSTELDESDPDGKKLEDALKTPGKPDKTPGKPDKTPGKPDKTPGKPDKPPAKANKTKGKTPSKKKAASTAKRKTETKSKHIEEETTVEAKKNISTSNLSNTAAKSNMDVNDITPNATTDSTHQLVTNARKDITSLLETPLKVDGEFSSSCATELVLEPTDTPFTPMLRANLKGLTVGDTFSIDTPDFPVTPGLSLMETSTTAYYILNDNETNKATEAIVLSEERKSSVRKTDDEDYQMSPKVYGCKEILEEFNKSRAAAKNLELLDNRGVMWDGSSDREDKSDKSESDDETNNTVIQNKTESVSNIRTSARVAGKNMAVLKSKFIEKNKDLKDDVDANSSVHKKKSTTLTGQENKDVVARKITSQYHRIKGFSSSSGDSEIVSKDKYKKRRGIQDTNKKENVCRSNTNKKDKAGLDPIDKLESMNKDIKNKNTNIYEDKISQREINDNENKCNNAPDNKSKEGKERGDRNNIRSSSDDKVESTSSVPKGSTKVAEDKHGSKEMSISSSKTEAIEKTVTFMKNISSRFTAEFSVRAEIEEKRKRVIESIQIAKTMPKTPSRRKATKAPQNVDSPTTNKRKRCTPTKLVAKRTGSQEKPTDVTSDIEKVDSQDEFFKRSGSNLHRTNKKSDDLEKSSDASKQSNEDSVDKKDTKSENVLKAGKCDSSSEIKTDVKAAENVVEPSEDKASSKTVARSEDTIGNGNESFWDECVMELQPNEIEIVYDENNSSKKRLEDYDMNLGKKGFQLMVPLADGSIQPVQLVVTPITILWEIKGSTGDGNGLDASISPVTSATVRAGDCSSDSEPASCRIGDPDDSKCAKKRKQRSDSCNSNASSKKLKTSLLLNKNQNIELLLNILHGPNENT